MINIFLVAGFNLFFLNIIWLTTVNCVFNKESSIKLLTYESIIEWETPDRESSQWWVEDIKDTDEVLTKIWDRVCKIEDDYTNSNSQNDRFFKKYGDLLFVSGTIFLEEVNAYNKDCEIPLETPIRFQVEISTDYPGHSDSKSYEKDFGVLILPENYSKSGHPVPLVIGCHGGGGTVDSTNSQTENYSLYKYLVSLGYAVMDMAGMPVSFSSRLKIDHFRCMGSFVAIKSYEAGYDYVINNFNIDTNGCYVTGGSNGGLTATNIVSLSSIPIICQGGMSPLLSLKEQAWNIPTGAMSGGEFSSYQNRANIIRIYKMDDVTTLDELLNAKYEDVKVGNFDPFGYQFDETGMIKKYPCPVKFWHPVDDHIISIDFSRKFITAIKNAGINAHLVEMPGGKHSPESFGQTLGFFKYQGEYLELKPAVNDLAVWFGKFSGIKPKYNSKIRNN